MDTGQDWKYRKDYCSVLVFLKFSCLRFRTKCERARKVLGRHKKASRSISQFQPKSPQVTVPSNSISAPFKIFPHFVLKLLTVSSTRFLLTVIVLFPVNRLKDFPNIFQIPSNLLSFIFYQVSYHIQVNSQWLPS